LLDVSVIVNKFCKLFHRILNHQRRASLTHELQKLQAK